VTARERAAVRVCHLTTVHAWDDTRIYHKECRTLAQAGYRVALVAPAASPAPPEDAVELIPLRRRSRRLARATLGVWEGLRQAWRSRAAIIHYHDPELIPAGMLLRLLGRRVIYDVHEDYPRMLREKPYLGAFAKRVLGRAAAVLEKGAGWSASAVVAVTPVIQRRFPAAKSVLVQNYALAGELNHPQARPYAERANEAIYVGSLGEARALREMLEAVTLLPGGLHARLRVVGGLRPGNVSPDLRQRLENSERVIMAGQQNRAQVARLLGGARIGILVYHPLPNYVAGQPTKLFEYMSAGLPVIGSDFPRWREIITGIGCGFVVDPLDPARLAEAMEYLFNHPAEAAAMGERGRQAVALRYSWEAQGAALTELYDRLAAPAAARRRPRERRS
jgi:glycosyltransferase involved in cell wall biosynthesis